MKRIGKIALVVVLIALLAVGGFCWWQWEQITVLLSAKQYSSQELEEQLVENHQRVQEAVNILPEIAVRDLNEEEKTALREGTLSEEELLQRLIGDVSQETEGAEDATSEPTPQAEPKVSEQNPSDSIDANEADKKVASEEQQSYQKALAELVARVYIMQQEYTNTLDSMTEQAKQEYLAMDSSQRTKAKLIKWAGGYVSRAVALEKECDKRMTALADEMTKLLRENGGDLTLVDEIIAVYANEKSLKKAQYMLKLEERGLL